MLCSPTPSRSCSSPESAPVPLRENVKIPEPGFSLHNKVTSTRASSCSTKQQQHTRQTVKVVLRSGLLQTVITSRYVTCCSREEPHMPPTTTETPLYSSPRDLATLKYALCCLIEVPHTRPTNGVGRPLPSRPRRATYLHALSCWTEKPPIHLTTKEGRPLVVASWFGSVSSCELLLSRGADHTQDIHGRTPLHIAAQSGRVDCCILLLLNGATHVPDSQLSWTPLHAAACALNNSKEVCMVLLDSMGTAIHTPDKHGDTPLHLAIRTGTMPIRGGKLRRRSTSTRARFFWIRTRT